MSYSTRTANTAKKSWATPSIAEFNIAEITQTGGADVADGPVATNEALAS